jgi:membrane fusion protein (multidrug efflux system)
MRRKSIGRVIIGVVILVVVAVLCAALVWFNIFKQGMIAQYFAHFPVPTVTVSTMDVKPQKWTPMIDAVGTVTAVAGVDVAGQVGGVVRLINFSANQVVQKGKVLVQLEDSVERAGLASAKSSVAVDQDALDRTRRLFNSNFATTADLQAAQNKLDQAQGALAQIEATLEQKAIKAPFDGTIGIPKVDVGQFLPAGTAVATLQDLSKMRVDFTVPEQNLPRLSIGQPVSIGLSEGHLDFNGAITGIDPKIDATSRLISVQAIVDNSKGILRPGQFARVQVHLPEEQNVIALPQTAVVISLYGSYVYQVVPAPPAQGAEGQAAAQPTEGSKQGSDKGQAPAAPKLIAKQIFVETGRLSDTQIEITKGIDAGMQVVTSGQNKLSNGSPVAVDNSVNPATASGSTGG